MIRVERPEEKKLDELGVRTWPIWEKEISEFPWEYDMEEICYILEGEATVTAEGGNQVAIMPGCLVTFTKGTKCRWSITKPIRKHYDFR